MNLKLILLGLLSLLMCQGAEFSFELEKAGQISAAVYDAEGRLIRTLLMAENREAGQHALNWDGLDRHGEPQPPGSYVWRVLAKPPFKATYLAMLGAGHPHHPPVDNWIGNHDGPGAIAVDESGLYIGASTTENVHVLGKSSLDGARNDWFIFGRLPWLKGRWQGTAAVTSDGAGRVYMLQQNGLMHVLDAATGDRHATWDMLPPGVERRDHLFTNYERVQLAARGESLVIAYRDEHRVAWIDTTSGAVTVALPVPTPRDIAIGPAGQVIVLSDDRLLEVQQTGDRRDLGIEARPSRFAIAENGEILLFEKQTRQIKRFATDGRLLATYGREGGRRQGRFVPEDFADVSKLVADGAGGFFVAEPWSWPRRVARFDGMGRMLHTWYGGEAYWNWGVADPRQPMHVWLNAGNEGEWLILVHLDYQTGHWRVMETHEIKGRAEGLVWCGTGGTDGRMHILYRGDRRYILLDQAMPIPFVHDEQTHTLEPIIAGGIGERQGLAAARAITGEGETATAWLWTDLNGDRVPQPEEIRFDLAVRPYNRTSSGGIGPDFSWYNVVTPGTAFELVRRPVAQWTEHGVPIYADADELLATAEQWVERLPDQDLRSNFYKNVGILASTDGSLYVMGNVHPPEHGDQFPTNRTAQNRVAKFASDGSLRWKVGRHASTKFGSPAGYMHQLVGFLGEVHGCVIVGDRAVQPAAAWDRDGLYAGDFLATRADDGLPDRVYEYRDGPAGAILNGDCLATSSIFALPDGDVVWFAPGQGSTPVYRISGWQGWQRHNGTLTLAETAQHARAEGSGLHGDYFSNINLDGAPVAAQLDRRIWMSLDERFPQSKGGSRVLDAVHQSRPAYAWPKELPAGIEPDHFSTRWTGRLEVPLSEAFTFSLYIRGEARLWLNDTLIIDGWQNRRTILTSEPIALQAGQLCSLRLEYRSSVKLPAISLNWESPSLERERIPQTFLYPLVP